MAGLDVMLAYSGDKLVSLVASSVVDDGRTYVSRAGRTLPEFRGRSVNKQLVQALQLHVSKKYPNILRLRFASESSSYPYKKLMQLEVLSWYVETATLRSQQILPIDSVEIQSRSKEYICDVIFSGPVAQKLFPDNVLMVERFPIEPLRSNIDYLMQENGGAVYFAVENCVDGAPPRSVSFGVLSQREKYTRWSATIYCCSDAGLYRAHLVHQFKRACEVIKGAFVFLSFHDKQFTDCGRRVLNELDKGRSKESLACLYEQIFLPRQSHL